MIAGLFLNSFGTMLKANELAGFFSESILKAFNQLKCGGMFFVFTRGKMQDLRFKRVGTIL
jgi:hypothetical protein